AAGGLHQIGVAVGGRGWRRGEVAVEQARTGQRIEREQRLVVGDMLLRLRGGKQRQAAAGRGGGHGIPLWRKSSSAKRGGLREPHLRRRDRAAAGGGGELVDAEAERRRQSRREVRRDVGARVGQRRRCERREGPLDRAGSVEDLDVVGLALFAERYVR